jgi:threonyl-tRNA synthetase
MSSECDHRVLARRLNLLHFQDEAPGMVFWHPRGLQLYRLLEQAVRSELSRHRYAEVKTPQVLRRPVWEASGHWQHFHSGMFHLAGDGPEAALKPVSCPGHIYVVQQRTPSYRELPIRIAELGVVHRDEPGGTLHGLMRLRQFTQDDGHIFCAEEHIEAELMRFCESLAPFYRGFGFEHFSLSLSTRPIERFGDDAAWDHAEALLAGVMRRLSLPYTVQEGDGAFYGPKLELVLEDRHGRAWQCGTIQVDLQMPVRFGLRFVDPSGGKSPLFMLHRALFGSLERFLGILLEHHGGHLPVWIAPVQAVVLPVGSEQHGYAEQVQGALLDAGLRAELDARPESLSRRLVDAHEACASFILVVGKREAAERAVSLREREAQRVLSLDGALAHLLRAVETSRPA